MELVTFVKIGTCNGTSYNFKPLERNLTSYIWNGTCDTTGSFWFLWEVCTWTSPLWNSLMCLRFWLHMAASKSGQIRHFPSWKVPICRVWSYRNFLDLNCFPHDRHVVKSGPSNSSGLLVAWCFWMWKVNRPEVLKNLSQSLHFTPSFNEWVSIWKW